MAEEAKASPVKEPTKEASAAEGIFEEFREHSVAEFFKKNRQMLGFAGRIRSLTTIVHEAITNSLDAAEEAKILPNIYCKIEEVNGHCKVYVEDNGPGIPPKYIGRALGQMLAGTKFHRFMQQRGQQGIGISGVCLFSQITTGKLVHARSGMGDGKVYECDIAIDTKRNTAQATNVVEYAGKYRGLAIGGEFAEVKYDKSEYSPLEYVKATAMANPHAQITFIEPDGNRIVFPRASEKIPSRPKPAQPHPLGITNDDLMTHARHSPARKLSSFLTQEFARVSDSKVDELRKLCPAVNFDKMPRELKWEEAEAIVNAFKQVKWIAPSADPLRPMGKDQIEKALKTVLNPEFLSVTERPPKVYRGGVPFAIECAIAYGGKSGRPAKDGVGLDIKRFANRAPLLFDAGGCAITQAVKSIDWTRYNLKGIEMMPITLFINLVSVYVPYTGAGKQAIADEDEVMEELRWAIMEAARDLDRYLSGKVRDEQRDARKKAIMRYVKQLSEDLPSLAGEGNSKELEKQLVYIIEHKYAKILGKKDAADGGEEIDDKKASEPAQSAKEPQEEEGE